MVEPIVCAMCERLYSLPLPTLGEGEVVIIGECPVHGPIAAQGRTWTLVTKKRQRHGVLTVDQEEK